MRFIQEFWLYLVPLIPLVWLGLRAADRRADRRLKHLLGPNAADHREGVDARLVPWRRTLLLLGLFWLLLALARPQWGANEVVVTQRGSDIVIALDISNSMLAEDVVPNRLGRAITELTSFLNRLEGSRVGLVFFAGGAFVQCPLTIDYGTAEIFLKMAGPDMLSQQGTDIASALKTSRELMAKNREAGRRNNFQAILIVTDGEDLEGEWETEAEKCRSEGIKVIPVGVGDKGGGLIPAFDKHGRRDGFLKDEEGNVVMTRLDLASLEKMAGISGGSSFMIGVDGLAGDRLFAELQRLGRRDLEERKISSYKERSHWPLALALLCFGLRFLLRARRPRSAAGPVARVWIALALSLSLLQASPALAVLKPDGGEAASAGRQLYVAGRFEEALERFEAALIEAPEDPRISLALGETLHQLERYAEAEAEFIRAHDYAEDPELRSEALYNLGTTRLASGQIQAAADDLLASLQLDPGQADALHNLEVALRRLQQQQQEQQQENQEQQQDEQDQQDQQENQDQQQDQPQENQDQQQEQQEQQDQKDQENQENQENQEQDQQDQQPEEQESSPPEEGTQEMTREQALQLLNALDKDEEELKRSVQKRLRGGRSRSGKKW